MESKGNVLALVRASFIVQGTSFNAWCKANHIVRRSAEQALLGDNKSSNARELAEFILKAAGLMDKKAV